MEKEIFYPVKKVKDIYGKVYDFTGLVSISESGLVFVHPKRTKHKFCPGYIVKGRPAHGGHLQVKLMDKNDEGALFYIHRLVAFTFLPKPKKHQDNVLHLDDNPANNHYTNLKWGTHKENMEMARVAHKRKNNFIRKYDDQLIIEVFTKKENGASIRELIEEYKDKVTPSAIPHMTSGLWLKNRGYLTTN